MQRVYHSPTQLFSHVPFSISSLSQLEWLGHLQQSPVPLQFPLPDMVIATSATPLIGLLFSGIWGYLYRLVVPGWVPW